MKNILSIDIGGTEVKYGYFDGEQFEYIGSIKTNTAAKDFSMIETLYDLIESLTLKYKIEGIAISTAGMVDSSRGTIIFANENIPNYTGTQVKKLIEKRFNVPCTVENDVNCAALGEKESLGVDNFMMITIGTGLGGALVIDGELYKGTQNIAGEIGYMIHNGQNIEDVISTSALVRSVPGAKSGMEVFNLAKNGDQDSIEAIDSLCDNLGQVLSNFASLLNPEAFVLGGGIMEQTEYLEPIIDQYFKKYSNKKVYESTKILFATLGNKAGMMGALNYFQSRPQSILDHIKGGLVVSCQALEGEPLHSPYIMSKMALAAKQSGAVGIRAQGVSDINEIKKQVDLPVIGIIKRNYPDSEVFITATLMEVNKLLSTECEMIALDATSRHRPNGENLRDLLEAIHSGGRLAMADCSTYEECIIAQELGFDCVSTTLCGYTDYSEAVNGPNFKLIEKLQKTLSIPLIAEGKINTPDDLKEVYRLGVHSAVVGGAITRPQEITKRFVDSI